MAQLTGGISFTVEFQGGDQMLRNLAECSKAAQSRIPREALEAGANIIRDDAAQKMVRSADPPHAADNVVVTLGRGGRSAWVGPSSDYHYWLFQELGTVNHPPQPGLRPAFDTTQEQVLTTIKNKFWEGLEAAIRPPQVSLATARGRASGLVSTTSATFL